MPYLHNIFTVYEILNDMFLCGKQKPKRVKAMYNCVADNPDELTFSEGEVIVVDGEEDQEWWVSIHYTSVLCRGLTLYSSSGMRENQRTKVSLLYFPFYFWLVVNK